MSRNFPMSWASWKEGVENLYRLKKELEEKLKAGESLTDEQRKWLERATQISTQYDRTGHKRNRGREKGGSSFEAKVAGVKAEAEKLSGDRRAQLLRELKKGSER